MIKIDYKKNNIINLATSILSIYNATSGHKPLDSPAINALGKTKNILFFVFDGLGYNFLMKSKADYLKKNTVSRLQTVFPPTTTAAMTTLYTGLTPAEHSMIGWSLYYKEYSLLADVLPKHETVTQKRLDKNVYLLDNMPDENIFSKIRKADKDINIHFIAPDGIQNSDYTLKATNPSKISSFKQLSDIPILLKRILEETSNPNFVFIYSDLPDLYEHICGVDSKEAADTLQAIERVIFDIRSMTSKDSSIIITSDHGLTDVEIDYINNDKELYDLILLPIFPEPRFFSLFLKEKTKSLPDKILKRYENQYYILNKKTFISKGLLGPKFRKETYDNLGEYIFISKAKHGMENYFKHGTNYRLMAHHAGLTEDEMFVPLIII